MFPHDNFPALPSLSASLHPSDDDAKNVWTTDSNLLNFDVALPNDISQYNYLPPPTDVTPKVELTDHSSSLLKSVEDTASYDSLKAEGWEMLFGGVSTGIDPISSSDMIDFMPSILGETPHTSGLVISSLSDDLFSIANKESEKSVFPNVSDSATKVVFPEANEETYKWRGDMGLFDRLSYKTRDKIPRNWKETTIDPLKIADAFRQIESPVQHLLDNYQPQLNDNRMANMPSKESTSQDVQRSKRRGQDPNAPAKKRVRINKKPPKGNNRYGRKGTLTCLHCRAGSQKCVYSSEDQPCTRCQRFGLDGCIKISRQTYTALISNSRNDIVQEAPYRVRKLLDPALPVPGSVPLPIGRNVYDFEEVSPLFLWDHGIYGIFDTLCKDAATVLTSAALALRALNLSPSEFRDDLLFWFECASLRLDDLLDNSETFFFHFLLNDYVGPPVSSKKSGSMDLLMGSTLLGWVTYSANVSEVSTASYFKLSYAQVIAQLALDSLERKFDPLFRPQDLYHVCASFALDCANAWLVRNGSIPDRTTTFAQRVSYFAHFEQLSSRAWHSSNLEAANATLGNLFEVSLTSALRFTRNEINSDFSKEGLDNVLLYIRAELGDVDLHRALRDLYRSHQGNNTNHTTVVGQLITRIFHRLRCVLLLHAILSQASVFAGVQCPDALIIAQKIVCFCAKQVIRHGDPIEDYFLQSWHNFSYLMLGGMGLTDDCPQAMRDWVISELLFIGREECATALSNYWENRGMNELVQILEFAQYPKPMDEEWQI